MSAATYSHANAAPLAERLQLAQDPATPPQQLAELAQGTNSRAIKQAVVRNPNTPPADLLRLAGRYWAEFLENPVLPLLLLEDPGLLHRLPVRALRTLVRREGMPPLVLQTLARHSDREVREGAKFHVAADEGEAIGESTDWHIALRRELERLPAARATLPELLSLDAVPDWLLEAVAGTSNRTLQAAVIRAGQRPGAPATLQATSQMLRRAVGEPLTRIKRTKYGDYKRHYRLGKGSLTPDEVARLAQGSRTWQVLAAQSEALDTVMVERLARSPHWQVGAALAANPNLTATAAMQLASRGDVRVLRRLVRSRTVPVALLPGLARSADEDVRAGVARHAGTPAATLAQLAGDANARVRRMVAANRHTPPAALLNLATDVNGEVREQVAFNRQTPTEAFEKLLADASVELRTALARDGRLPPVIIRRLYDDPNREVRHAAFFNRRNPRFVLDFIIEHGWAVAGERPPVPEWGTARGWDHERRRYQPIPDAEQARKERVQNDPTVTEADLIDWYEGAHAFLKWGIASKASSAEFLTRLAADADLQVRRYVASNPRTPLEVLRTLAADPKKKVRYGAGENQTIATQLPDVLVQLATDRKAFVRNSVANNKHTPPELLDRLADDPNADTRDHAASNPNTSPATLARLGQLPLTGRLRNSVLGNPNTPVEVLLAWRNTSGTGILDRLASNPNTPVAVLWELAQAPIDENERDLRSSIARNPGAPAELLQWLWDNQTADDKEHKIGWALVSNANLSEELFLHIVRESEESICSSFLEYPRLTPELFEQVFLSLDLQKKTYLVYSAKKKWQVWERLFEDGEQKVLERLARERELPLELMRRLAALPGIDKWAQVGMNLLNNLAAPSEILLAVLVGRAEEDATNGRPWWYAVAVENRNVTAEILNVLMERLLHDRRAGRDYPGHYEDKLWLNLAKHPLLDPAHLSAIAEHTSREVREAVLQRADCPPELRAEMRATALTRNLEEATSVLGRASALADATTTATTLFQHYPKAGWVERLAMLQNPRLPADLLTQLAEDAHRLVRAAARERQTTGQIPDLTR
jgi:hypothetical protein